MKTCRYTIINDSAHPGDYSYQDLAEFLLASADAFGILYDKTKQQDDFGRQNEAVDKLEALKEQGLAKFREGKGLEQSYSFMEGSADINVDEKDFTVQTLVDSNHYVDKNGQPLMHVYDNEEWVERQRMVYEKQGLDPEEVGRKVNILKDKGQKIAKNAYELHKIILKEQGVNSKNYVLDDTRQAAKGTVFEPLAEEIHTRVASDIYGEVRKKNGRNSKEAGDTSEARIIKNITISAPLIGTNSKVYAHLDYVAVKPDGSLDVYLIKASHESPSSWDKAKNEKYRNEIALMMQILEANGVDISNISFNIIPVVMRYDEQYNNVSEIQVDNAICYSHNKGAFILHEALTNARRFIESNETQVEVDDKNFEVVDTQLSALFPEMDIKSKGITQTAAEYIDKNWDYLIQGQ
jgi:hypothetical protein